MEDHEIVALYFARDERALIESERKYDAYLKRIVMNVLRNDRDAEELVNDTYFAAWNSIPPQKPRSLKAYLATICRRFAINRYNRERSACRGGGATEEAFEELSGCIPGTSVEDLIDLSELRRAIRSFMRTLTEENAIIFLQKYWYMRTIAEISKDRRISETAVKASLRRTREKLRAYLRKEGIDL